VSATPEQRPSTCPHLDYALAPDDAALQHGLGTVLTTTGDARGAKQQFEIALRRCGRAAIDMAAGGSYSCHVRLTGASPAAVSARQGERPRRIPSELPEKKGLDESGQR
jgi:hypothetical protein